MGFCGTQKLVTLAGEFIECSELSCPPLLHRDTVQDQYRLNYISTAVSIGERTLVGKSSGNTYAIKKK